MLYLCMKAGQFYRGYSLYQGYLWFFSRSLQLTSFLVTLNTISVLHSDTLQAFSCFVFLNNSQSLFWFLSEILSSKNFSVSLCLTRVELFTCSCKLLIRGLVDTSSRIIKLFFIGRFEDVRLFIHCIERTFLRLSVRFFYYTVNRENN